jgi:DNA repair exonuclease SbcCD ATPase subunit
MGNYYQCFLTCLIFLSVAGCRNPVYGQQNVDEKTAINPAAISVDEKNEYQRRVENYLNDVDQWMANMRAKLNTASRISRDEISATLPKIQTQLEKAREELEELKYATSDTWERRTKNLDQAVQDLKNAHYRMVSRLREEREEYETRLQSEVQDLDRKLNELNVQTSTVAAKAGAEFREKVNDLRNQREAASAKLNQLRQSSAEQWIELKRDLDQLLSRWEDRYHALIARIKRPEPGVQIQD